MIAAVTGWALRTPLGDSAEELTRRWLAGDRAAKRNDRFSSDTYACRLAAPIVGEPRPSPHQRVLHRIGLFAVEVGHEAIALAACARGPRLGLFSAMGGLRVHWEDVMPALASQRQDLADSWARGFKKLHPFWMLQHLSNNAHALLAQDLGARGDGVTFSGSNAGAQALAAAERALRDGAVDAALVIAYDSLIEPETVVEMAARFALTSHDVDDLAAPYDQLASGMVPGEAAAALVLESPAAAERALAFLSSADGADGRKGDPTAATIARVVARVARRDAVVDGSARADRDFDAGERVALSAVLSPTARLLALQGATGYLGAAAAPVQAVALSSLLRQGRLPPISGLREPAEGPLTITRSADDARETSAVGVSVGAPGLVGAIRVSIAREGE